MEIPAQGVMFLQSLSSTQSMGLNTGISSDSGLEQWNGSEPDTQPESNPIDFRITQLLNRRFFLLKMQSFRNKTEDNCGGTTEEMAGEDSDDLSELDAVQKELEELQAKKEELEKRERSSKLSNGLQCQQDACPTFHKTETPRGGVYLLPAPCVDTTLEQRIKTRPGAERPTGRVVPVDSLGQTPAVTQCPSCQEIIVTETCSQVGETMWTLCCLCSMIGCIAGCCLIPFFKDYLKDVRHRCPQCQTHIHTYYPF